MRGLKPVLILLAAMLAGAALAQPGKVTIVTPEKDAVVRGILEVIADKPNPNEGTYAWKIARVGREAEAEFGANTLAGLPFVWDTRARDENGDRFYPDGKYTITANAFDGDAKLQGAATTTIAIENDIPAADVADGVELKILLKANDSLSYTFEGSEKLAFDLYPQVEGAEYTLEMKLYEGAYDLKMLGGAGMGEGGIARQTCTNGIIYLTGMQPEFIKDAAKEFTQQYSGDGAIAPRRGDDPHFAIGECYLKLPGRKLTLGARPWKSDLQLVLELYTMKQHLVTAEHAIDGFEWVAGRRCARLKSTIEEKGLQFDVTVQGQPAKITGDFTGTRVTYFAYESGYPVSIEDTIHADAVEIEFKQQAMGGMAGGMPGMGMEGGMAGMGGMPGMGMPGGMPGMGMPGGMPGMGMPGGMPGMGMPGGMPGMGMPGGMPGMGMPGGMPGMGMPGGMPGMGMPGGMPGMGMEGGMPGMGMGGGMPGMGAEAGMGGAQPQQAQKLKAAVDVTLRIALRQ